MIGKTLGHYRITEKLGEGGMGIVYKARDTRPDRDFALKVLPPSITEDPERMRRFVREAKAASALSHPNIATIHDIGEAEGIHFIVMEHVEGQTLQARLQGRGLATGPPASKSPVPQALTGEGVRPLEVPEILNIGLQVADALEAAHAKGIIHRDIKSANLMLTPRVQVKVLDFGLAKRLRQIEPSQSWVPSELKDEGDAFEWLDRAFEERNPYLVLWRTPVFDSLRSERRFEDSLRRFGPTR